MHAVMGRFDEAMDFPAADRRRSVRYSVWAQATILSSRGLSADAELSDLSTHGLCVVSQAPWLRVGQFVSIVLENEEPVQAIVRWMRDGAAGMEFLRPVPADRKAWHALIN